jgi:hypothetical protein
MPSSSIFRGTRAYATHRVQIRTIYPPDPACVDYVRELYGAPPRVLDAERAAALHDALCDKRHVAAELLAAIASDPNGQARRLFAREVSVIDCALTLLEGHRQRLCSLRRQQPDGGSWQSDGWQSDGWQNDGQGGLSWPRLPDAPPPHHAGRGDRQADAAEHQDGRNSGGRGGGGTSLFGAWTTAAAVAARPFGPMRETLAATSSSSSSPPPFIRQLRRMAASGLWRSAGVRPAPVLAPGAPSWRLRASVKTSQPFATRWR